MSDRSYDSGLLVGNFGQVSTRQLDLGQAFGDVSGTPPSEAPMDRILAQTAPVGSFRR